MVPYSPIWRSLVLYVYSRVTHMVPYGPVLAHIGPYWPHMALYDPLWPHTALYGPIWSRIILVCFVWPHMNLHGPVWSHIILVFVNGIYSASLVELCCIL